MWTDENRRGKEREIGACLSDPACVRDITKSPGSEKRGVRSSLDPAGPVCVEPRKQDRRKKRDNERPFLTGFLVQQCLNITDSAAITASGIISALLVGFDLTIIEVPRLRMENDPSQGIQKEFSPFAKQVREDDRARRGLFTT